MQQKSKQKESYVLAQDEDYYFQLIDSSEAQKRLGYKDASSFRRAVIEQGIPKVEFNSRRVMYDVRDLAEWVNDRKVGRKPFTHG